MAWGLFAFHAQAQGISAVLAQLPALADQSLAPVSSNYVVPGTIGGASAINKLAGLLAVGASITNAQLQSPSLRQLFFPDIRPLDISANPTSPDKWIDLSDNMVQLASGEQLEALITNTAADVETLLIQLTDGAYGAVGGEIQTVKASGSTTLTAGAWTNAAITLSQTLPVGRYQVVGMRYEGVSAIAARVVFPGGYWRPGCPGFTVASAVEDPHFRYGGYGVWGEFSTTVLPTVDCLASAADTAQTFFLDLVRVSETP